MLIIDEHLGRYVWKKNETCEAMGSFMLVERKSHLEIWAFGIYGQYRGNGYGQQMLKEAVELAGDRKLILYVMKDNDVALHVYKKGGFEITGKYMNGHAWVMTYVGDPVGTSQGRMKRYA